jgi:hypothetical protein
MIVPSGSSIATQGTPVSSALSFAGFTGLLSSGSISELFIKSSSFDTADFCTFPLA